MKDEFSIRCGYEEAPILLIGNITDECQNRLWNMFSGLVEEMYESDFMQAFATLNFMLDKIGEKFITRPVDYKKALDKIENYWEIDWYNPFNALEFFLEYAASNKILDESVDFYAREINEILENEKSGYRALGNVFEKITEESEIQTINEAKDIPFDSVKKAIQKAIKLYSDDKPDYENSIKESISAVESMCCIIVGEDNSLGMTLNELNKNSVQIHPALIKGFKALYGYASNEEGIRHGGIDFKGAKDEDAKYMLVTCAAFVNYLNLKYSRYKGELQKPII